MSPGGEGPETTGGGWRRPWGLYAVVALLVVAVVVGVVQHVGARPGGSSGSATPTSSSRKPTASPPSGAPAEDARPPVPGSSPWVTRHGGRPLLSGVPAGWELVAMTRQSLSRPLELIRIAPASGTVTTAQTPPLLTGGPVALVVGDGRVLVRPWDAVAGYLFPRDGQARRLISGPLGFAGPAIPGPRPGRVWVEVPEHPGGMRLVGLDGAPTGDTIQLPSEEWVALVVGDGAGYPLVQTEHGAYDVRPTGRHRVTRGSVVAIGPTRWLVHPCPVGAGCGLALVDRRTGARRAVPPVCPVRQLPAAVPRSGTISPDGHTAVLFCVGSDFTRMPYLLDVTTGRSQRLHLRLERGDPGLVWAPNSRWLFTIDADGQLTAVDAHDGEVHTLAPGLPPLAQLAAG